MSAIRVSASLVDDSELFSETLTADDIRGLLGS